MICDFCVIQIRHWKMGIALNSYFWQMYQCYVSAAAVYGIPELLCDRKKNTPLFLSRVCRMLLRDIVPVIDDNRDFDKFHGIRRRAFGKNKIAARLKGSDCLYIIINNSRAPTRPAALRMCNQNALSYLVKQGRNRVNIYLGVVGACIGQHLTIELVQGFRVFRELNVRIKVRIDAKSENAKPKLFVRRRGNSYGLRTAGCPAAPRLVNQVNGIATAKENILNTFSAVGSSFPRLCRLPMPVPKY